MSSSTAYMKEMFGYISMEDKVSSKLRLSTDVLPSSYYVQLDPDYESSKFTEHGVHIAYSGEVGMEFSATSDQECVVLHADEMTISQIGLSKGQDKSGARYVGSLGYDFQRTFVMLCDIEDGGLVANQ